MRETPQASGDRHRTGRWQPVNVLSLDEAAEFARTARITRSAQREYMATHIVSEETAEQQVRQLVERILSTGRLAREQSGTMLRARSHKADGEAPYSFLLDPATGYVIGYRGPATSWFDEVHVPIEDLLTEIDERHRQEKEKAERRTAHEQRMREQREAAADRQARTAELATQWPQLPQGQYDRGGNPAPPPRPRRPLTDEDRIRCVGRLPHVVFHADALNSTYFRDVPPQNRCEALHRVLDVLLRAPSKGTVHIGSDSITVTGKRVTMTLTPDCAMVRTLNPPRPGNKNEPPRYRAAQWTRARETKQ
ncbi:hypothetical protein ACWD0J_39240 [Streptomyces sp. NPDC003011]